MKIPMSSSKNSRQKPQNPNQNSPSPSPSPSPLRQWRPAAQRNVRNQWSNILPSKDRFFSASYEARNHATSLVNTHLSQRYLPHMDFGDLKDMLGIREKAAEKLAIKQIWPMSTPIRSYTTVVGGTSMAWDTKVNLECVIKLDKVAANLTKVVTLSVADGGKRFTKLIPGNWRMYCSKLLSSYKDMVAAVAHMVQSSCSMRCFLKVSDASTLVQFCDHPEDINDTGDGGGIPVFTFFSISNFENLAQELVGMFLSELNLKRLLVVELLNINYKEGDARANLLRWSHELYPGEYDDLRMSNMLSEENNQPLPPQIKNWQSGDPFTEQSNHTRSSKVLQVYLTTWLADVNIDMNRMREIFSTVEEEIQVKLS